MALYPKPLSAIVKSIADLNPGVNLVEAEYIFGVPQVIADAPNGNNTQISVTAKDVNSTYDGTTSVTYRRLQLNDLATLVSLDIKAPIVTTTLQLAQILNSQYGLDFQTGDIVNSGVTLVDGAGPVTLVAQPNSLSWLGQVTFNVTPGRFDLAQYVNTPILPGLKYPDDNLSKPFAGIYSYWRDFTPAHELLDVLVVETPDWTNIRDALIQVTGDPWQTTATGRFSLKDATLVSKGLTVDNEKFNFERFTHAVVVKLNPAQNLGYSGDLYLQYNLPDDF